MHNFVRALGRAGPSVAVAGAVTAAQPSAHAREAKIQPRDDVLTGSRRISDAWELFDLDSSKEIPIFRSEEIDAAASILCRVHPSAVIEEVSDATSDGGYADTVIESSLHLQAAGRASAAVDTAQGDAIGLESVLKVASRLLKSPGVQQEICRAALQDPEILAILASQDDVAEYLAAHGFAASGLLLGPVDGEDSAAAHPATEAGAAAGRNLPPPALAALQGQLLAASVRVARGLERMGGALSALAAWLRRRLAPPSPVAAAAAAAAKAGDAAGADGAPAGGARLNAFMGTVMVAAVALVAVIVLRRPAVLLRGLRRGVMRF